MKIIEINPKKLQGSLEIPPSKSVSHRVIISAGLSEGESNITNVLLSQDMLATCEAIKALGAKIAYEKEKNGRTTLKIKGAHPIKLNKTEIDCRESGSTLRFMIPLLLLQEKKVTVTGKGRLVTRPMAPYDKLFKEKSIKTTHLIKNQALPLVVEGKLTPGLYALDGSVSSQFITGLLFALPTLKGDSIIEMTSPLESKPYVDISMEVLNAFGIEIINEKNERFIIKGNQRFKPREYRIEGDFSQGAFWLVAGTIGESIRCQDLNLNSSQGDKVIVDIIKKMAGNLKIDQESILAQPQKTKGRMIDVSHCPDLVPILGVLGSLSEGSTSIINGERLRYKESDRLMASAAFLNELGGRVKETRDGLEIQGVKAFHGGKVSSHNDHRIAMAVAIASIAATGKISLEGAKAVNKSYPHFWEDFQKIGGDCHGIDLGE